MSTAIMQITAAGGSAQNVFSESIQKKKKKKNNEQVIISKVIYLPARVYLFVHEKIREHFRVEKLGRYFQHTN